MKQQHYGVHTGSSSILLIFVLLCLVSFASLSIVSANADARLNQKVVERTTAYYHACNEVEKSLAQLDTTLSKLYESGISEADYFMEAGHSAVYEASISDTQNLEVRVTITYPEKKGDTFYSIDSWKVVTPAFGTLETEDSLELLF